jgi:hypothetical protein
VRSPPLGRRLTCCLHSPKRSMETSPETLAYEIWNLVHVERVPMRRAAARLELPVAEAYELLAREKLRREEMNLKWSVKISPE